MSTEQHSNYINGQWVPGATWSKNINPSDVSDVVGEYAQADAAQTEQAIAAARAAAPAWANFNVQARADLLEKVGSEMIARKDELGALLSREEGKTLPEGVGEVVRAGNVFKFFAGEVLRRVGELVPSVRPGIDVEVTREPLGVVGIISPWNFPTAIPAWKIAPALAYGNAVVFKPADLVPASSWAIAFSVGEELPEPMHMVALSALRGLAEAANPLFVEAEEWVVRRESKLQRRLSMRGS